MTIVKIKNKSPFDSAKQKEARLLVQFLEGLKQEMETAKKLIAAEQYAAADAKLILLQEKLNVMQGDLVKVYRLA